MIGRLLIPMLLLTMASCSTVPKKEPAHVPVEGDSLKVKEFNEYMEHGGKEEPSIDTIIRLSEGYIEAVDSLYRKEMDEYEKKMALYNNGVINILPQEPAPDYSVLINHFRELTGIYRYGKGADSIRYILGYALSEEGKRDEAVKVFEDLIQNYPSSGHLPEVNFRLGEIYFETGRMGDALDAYSSVLRYPNSVFYEKALYKLGWVHYKSDDFAKATDYFMKVVDGRWDKGIKEGGLIEESIQSAAMSLSRFKDMGQSTEYLESKGIKGYTPLIMMRLGDMLNEETRHEDSILVYRRLLERFPDYPELPIIFNKMSGIYEQLNDKETALLTRTALINLYNPTTVWHKKIYPEGSPAVDTLLSDTMIKVSKEYHARGKKGKIEDLNKAIDGYRLYLLSFPRDRNEGEINLLLAEALFDAGIYRDAGPEYEKAAAFFPTGRQRGEIAYSAFLTYELIFYQTVGDGKEAAAPMERILEAYRDDLAKSAKLERTLYKMADIYARLGLYDKARDALNLPSKGKDSVKAETKIAEFYIADGNLSEAEVLYTKLVNRSGEQALKERLGEVRYKIAEDRLGSGDYDTALTFFRRAYAVSKGFKLGEAALIKIGFIHIQKREMEALKEIAGNIAGVYPGSAGAVSLLVEGGRTVEKIEPLKAATLYETASILSRDPDERKNLVLASGINYENGGRFSEAEALFNRYLLEKEIPPENRAEVLFRLGNIQMTGGKRKQGIKTLKRLVELGSGDDQIMAKTRLLLLKERLDAYLDLRLSHPFEKTLKEKTRLLEGLIRDYSEVADYKIAELLPEVFFQIGLSLENFKDSIIQSERPGGMSSQEMEEYNFLLEEKAYPYEEQAVTSYEKDLLLCREQGIYNEWVKKGIERLAVLRPALYSRGFDEKGLQQEVSSLIDLGNWGEALISLKEMADKNPADPLPYKNIGIIYEIYIGDMEKALENYIAYQKGSGEGRDVDPWIDVVKARIQKREGKE